jgi:uncharacterized membrane protein
MDKLSLSLAAVTLALSVGAIVFQSFIVAPAVFGSLGTDQARDFLRTLFPRFFRFNAGCAAIAALSTVAAGALAGFSTFFVWATGGAVLMTACMLAALASVPSINAARDAGDDGRQRFRRLHALSVALTIVALVVGLAILTAIGSTSAGS